MNLQENRLNCQNWVGEGAQILRLDLCLSYIAKVKEVTIKLCNEITWARAWTQVLHLHSICAQNFVDSGDLLDSW